MSTFFSDILSIPTNPEDIFELNECLGHGKNGKVFKGTHKESKMVVAIKILQNSNMQDHICLHNQINLLKLCSECVFVINYYGSYFSHKRNEIWIIFEYCDCGSANSFITATDRTFTESEIATIIEMILKALVFLHSHNLIHRDIKGSNILLNTEGYAKLGDLDLGIQLEKSDEMRSSLIGSPYWMSPQVALNTEYDYKTDIWSLGITCIELSEGDPPLIENKPEEVIKMISDNNTHQGLSENVYYSKDFRNFVGKCLQINPSLRPTAKELLSHSFIKHYSKLKEYISNLVKYHQDAIQNYRIYIQQKEKDNDTNKKTTLQLKEKGYISNNNKVSINQYNSNINKITSQHKDQEQENGRSKHNHNSSIVINSNEDKEDKDTEQTPEFMQYIQKNNFIFDDKKYHEIEKKANNINLRQQIPKPIQKDKEKQMQINIPIINNKIQTLSYKSNINHNDMCYSLIHNYQLNKDIKRKISGNPTTADSSPKKPSKQSKTNQSIEENKHVPTISIEDLVADKDISNKTLSYLQKNIKSMRLNQKYELQCLNAKYEYLITKYSIAIDLLLRFPNVKTLSEYNVLYGKSNENNTILHPHTNPHTQYQNIEQQLTHNQIVSMTIVEDKDEEFNINSSNNTSKTTMNNKHSHYFA